MQEIAKKSGRRYAQSILIVLTLLLTACGREDKSKQEDSDAVVELPVEASAISRSVMQASFQGTASLEAEAVAQVVSKSSGVILQILVEEGDRVSAGALLARLESDRQRLSLAQAQANWRKVENDFKRQTELFNRKLIGSEAFERVKFDVETQRANLDIAQLELSYTAIRAPISGVISQRLVKLGNQIQIGQSLFRIDDFDPLEARVAVPEREMQSIKPGQDAQMLVDAISGEVFIGKVARVSPIVDPKTGTFEVVTQFQDASARLRSGMFGRINIVTAIKPDSLVVPRSALLSEGSDAAVFVVEKGKAHRKTLKLGLIADGKAEVLSGAAEGDLVITLGQNAVREGSEVKVVNAAPAEASVAAVPPAAAIPPAATDVDKRQADADSKQN